MALTLLIQLLMASKHTKICSETNRVATVFFYLFISVLRITFLM